MQVKSKAENYQNIKTNTSVGELEFKDGVCEVTDEQFKHLSDKRFSFMKLSPIGKEDRLEEPKKKEDKIEESVKEADPIHKEEESPVDPSELVEREEASEDVNAELIEQINQTDKLADLKEIAEALEFPEEEWKSIKSKDDVREYLFGKLKQ